MIGGGLFTQFFLEEGIATTDAWRGLVEPDVRRLADAIRRPLAEVAKLKKPSEPETEHEAIFPILELLGWQQLPQQVAGKRRTDVPDALLFLDVADKDAAKKLKDHADRFRHGVVVVENEARETKLDRAHGGGEAPSSQMLRYLKRADGLTGSTVRWGLLTNGRLWRLYWIGAKARAEGYVEIDLPAALDAPPVAGDDLFWFKVFLLLFRREALEPAGPSGQTFLDAALDEGRRYEERVTAALSEAVFERVFPSLVEALVAADKAAKPADPAWRTQAKDAALILLYRLLFVLFAEDRDLLPVRHSGYASYALRALREDAAELADAGRTPSAKASTWWPKLKALFAAIAEGDATMGLPPYNGGLFDAAAQPMLARIVLPDAALVPLIDALSREGEASARRWINYRDLSVQQLGAIYERLLEFEVVEDGAGVDIRLNAFARKNSGSYYTPEELVRLILRRAVGPLLAERAAAFEQRAAALAKDRRPKADRLADLATRDPAAAFLDLRVCDPAMGSGHFLVSLVDYLADETLAAMAEAPALAPWGEYRSPLAAKIEFIRAQILAQAKKHGWTVRPEHLDDKHIVRRIVLKRAIYGVDLNPMAVELAKLSLWLHSFTVGAPLSFLDHHLRCGDSLFGEFVAPVERDLDTRFGLAMNRAVAQARAASAGMSMVERLTDADIAEVRRSVDAFAGVEEATAGLRAFLDLYHSGRWLPPDGTAQRLGLELLFGGSYGDPVAIAAGTAAPKAPRADAAPSEKLKKLKLTPTDLFAAFEKWLAAARGLAAERRFLHWEPAFPGVWDDWTATAPKGGFDAVIGNPPWDRIKLQEVEWFALRVPAIAKAQRQADRKKLVANLRKDGGPVADDYDRAALTAEAMADVARNGGGYPLLSAGDVNLYSLFVERALRLVKAEGIVGLLVPSGIAADAGAAKFFRSVSTTGRLGALLDFENGARKPEPFFPDVHRSFKFCVLTVSGRQRSFPSADCAFFQRDAVEAEREAITLAPADFAAVNPNTGTAPVFRTRRDADLTLDIYRRLPVLVDRRATPPASVWPVRYFTMFHMTNDSGLFRTATELTKDGAYTIAGRRWKKGKDEWVPLMAGRSIHQFDHRFASVVENAENVHNPFGSQLSDPAQRADPTFVPTPQFWIAEKEVEIGPGIAWAIGFRDIARPTDVRTVIAALIPAVAVGNTLPMLLPVLPEAPDPKADAATKQRWKDEVEARVTAYCRWAPLLVANMNATVFDFIARQKVQSAHLNFYIVEQLPFVPEAGFAPKIGRRTAEEIVRDHVLRLTCVSDDMEAFARSQGHAGKPFVWDEEERLHLRARLDALFMLLYGLDRAAAEYVLGTFPIVAEDERKRFGGKFRSKDLILGYMAAFAAGDPDGRVAA